MKVSTIALVLVGLILAAEAHKIEQTSVSNINAEAAVSAFESESDSDSEDEFSLVQSDADGKLKGDDGIIDALTVPPTSCVPRLWMSADEMEW
jgi:hypothetical protein